MLTLYGHPISSFTWKALIALYENDTAFEPITVDQNTYADFIAKWPMGKFPILLDSDRDRMITETSVIIEYLDAYYPGRTRFLPKEPGYSA
ncbi:MAG: glutathione S-transferase family protein [Hyphomonadaceae bacterium]